MECLLSLLLKVTSTDYGKRGVLNMGTNPLLWLICCNSEPMCRGKSVLEKKEHDLKREEGLDCLWFTKPTLLQD